MEPGKVKDDGAENENGRELVVHLVLKWNGWWKPKNTKKGITFFTMIPGPFSWISGLSVGDFRMIYFVRRFSISGADMQIFNSSEFEFCLFQSASGKHLASEYSFAVLILDWRESLWFLFSISGFIDCYGMNDANFICCADLCFSASVFWLSAFWIGMFFGRNFWWIEWDFLRPLILVTGSGICWKIDEFDFKHSFRFCFPSSDWNLQISSSFVPLRAAV